MILIGGNEEKRLIRFAPSQEEEWSVKDLITEVIEITVLVTPKLLVYYLHLQYIEMIYHLWFQVEHNHEYYLVDYLKAPDYEILIERASDDLNIR